MDPSSSPAWIVGLFVPLAIMMAVAILREQWVRRRDRADGVLVTWDDLRLTRSHLLVGSGRNARRIPLSGLKATVEITAPPGSPDGEVLLTIANAGHDIRRCQPYSYGASGGAQMFAIKFNSLSGRAAPNQPGAAAGVPPEDYPGLRAA